MTGHQLDPVPPFGICKRQRRSPAVFRTIPLPHLYEQRGDTALAKWEGLVNVPAHPLKMERDGCLEGRLQRSGDSSRRGDQSLFLHGHLLSQWSCLPASHLPAQGKGEWRGKGERGRPYTWNPQHDKVKCGGIVGAPWPPALTSLQTPCLESQDARVLLRLSPP